MTRIVLITGAGGFLARHTAENFRTAGWRVIGLGRSDPDRVMGLYDVFQLHDLSDPSRIASVLEKFTPELVIHLASPASVPESLARPLSDLESHVLTTGRLLEAIRLSRSRLRLLLISSAAVYGEPVQSPVPETAPLRPLSPYGFHKLHQELLCDEYFQMFGVPTAKARVFSTFGEGLRRLAVWELTKRMLAGEGQVQGTGEEVRDYLYVRDVASAFRTIAERAVFDGVAINVASGLGTRIAELARIIHEAVRHEGILSFTGKAAEAMPMKWVADVTRLRSLGWEPRHSLKEDLAITIDWIRRNA